MLEVTVKTLDGKNRTFCVPEEITVKQFKDKIAGSIEISAETQRLIFHGRVLQNEKKLNQYDVNGKTIHVVQSKPPARTEASSSSGASTSSSAASGGGGGTTGGRSGPGSSFVLGSFSVPSDVVDPTEVQNIVQQALSGMGNVGRNARVSTRAANDGSSVDVHINLGQIAMPPPVSESQQRIAQARRMLQAARTSLNKLENPTRPNQESESSMDTSSSPESSTPSQDGAATNADVEMDSSRSDEGQTPPGESPSRTPPEGEGQPESRSSEGQPQEGGSSTPEGESSNSDGQRGTPQRGNRPRQPTSSVLAELFQEVLELNRRLQPFLERYHQLLESDPTFSGENQTQERTDAQRLFNHVSEILHYVSHAYHSISDLMVDMQRAPPRNLSAAVAVTVAHPVGMPINVADIAQAAQSARNAAAGAGSGTTTTTSSQSGPRPATTQAQTNLPPGGLSAAGLGANAPFQDVTVDIGPNSVTINSVSAHVVGPMSSVAGPASQPQSVPQGSSATSAGRTGTTQTPAGGAPAQPGMIPPDILQNIIQMATAGARGHGAQPVLVISQGVATPTQVPPVHMPAPRMSTTHVHRPMGSGPAPRSSTTTASSGGAPGPRPRGATFMIPRPPMPGMVAGGPFGPPVDPFLPCQSRHFLGRRAMNAAQSSGPASSSPEQALSGMVSNLVTSLVNQSQPFVAGGARPQGAAPNSTTASATSNANVPPAFANLFSGAFGPQPPQSGTAAGGGGQPPPFLDQLRDLLQQGQPPVPPPTSSTPSSTTSSTQAASSTPTTGTTQAAPAGGQATTGMSNEIFTQLVGGISSYVSQAALGQQPADTVGDFLDRLGEQYGMSQGEPSFLTDVFNCVSRHLTFVDLMSVFFGQGAPLQRIRVPLQEFIRERVLEGREGTEENLNEAVEKLLRDMEPDINSTIESVTAKEDVDFKATMTEFLRCKLKALAKRILEASESDSNFGTDLLAAIRGSVHELIVLSRCCLEGGDDAVETMFQNRVRSISHDVNPMIQQWMVGMSTHQIRQVLPHVAITEEQIQCHIRRRQATATAMDAVSPQSLDASSYMSAESADVAPPVGTAEEVATCSQSREHNESMELEEQEEDKEESDHVRQKRPKLDPNLLEKVPLPPKHESRTNGSVAIGSEDWHQVVPESWVPIITRDAETQSRQGYQAPHSDAYTSGMPAKRRKLMTSSQDHKLADMKTVLPDTIRKTAQVANATPSTASVDEVVAASADSETLQAAFRQEVTTAIRQRVENDPDFIAGKFPSTEKLLEKD